MLKATEKQELRKHLKAMRNELSPAQVSRSSDKIAQHILACDAYKNAKLIMGYLAFGKELSVDRVLLQALADGKRVVVPFITSPTEMEAAVFTGMENLCLDRFRIRCVAEPAVLVDPADIDLLLVPGVAFGRDGSRMGMGAGYYDRFLLRAPQAITLGVAYDSLLQEHLPMDEYDIPVQYLVSETGIEKLQI